RIVLSDSTSIGQPSFSRQARTSAKSIGAHHNADDADGQRPVMFREVGVEYWYAKVVDRVVPPHPHREREAADAPFEQAAHLYTMRVEFGIGRRILSSSMTGVVPDPIGNHRLRSAIADPFVNTCRPGIDGSDPRTRSEAFQ